MDQNPYNDQYLKQSVQSNSDRVWSLQYRMDDLEKEVHMSRKCCRCGIEGCKADKCGEIGIILRQPDGSIALRFNDVKDRDGLLTKGFVSSFAVSS